MVLVIFVWLFCLFVCLVWLVIILVQNPNSRLILPSDVVIKPFAISKQLPGQEYKDIEDLRDNRNNQNFRYSENEEYKDLYEKLKINYEKLVKNY